MNLAGILEYSARFFPERTAAISQGREISYAFLNEEANRVASGLARLNIRPGDNVAICQPNGITWIAAYFGILKTGATAVTLFSGLSEAELNQLLDDGRPRAIFMDPGRLSCLEVLRKKPYLENVICAGGDISYEQLIETGQAEFRTIDRDRSDTAAILYTGGTTGRPKGAMLSHENILTSASNVAVQERSTEKDRALCFLPLNHVFGQIHIMASTIYSAGSLIILPSFDLDEVLDCIRDYQVTKFYSVPTVYVRLLAVNGLKQRLKSIRYCFSAAASMAQELVRQWKEVTGLSIYEAYGLTESASMVTYNHYNRHVVGSVGTPVGTVEVAIRDPKGKDLDTGQEGEICIRGLSIMKGYLNQPRATADAFRGTWFRTGDVGLLDEQGYLYIIDRIKDLIITGGENVYPSEVEELLYERSEVEECSVIGLPDPEYGERVTAVIVTKAGTKLKSTELKEFLKERLSSYKVPKEFLTVDELPKNAAGKILKRELKKNLTA